MLKRIATACLAASIAATPIADAYARCVNAKERMAMSVRVMQTELMVAALSCRAVPGRDFTGQYNAFVKTHGERLVNHSKVLQAYFKERYGATVFRRELDAFITALANDASRRSMNSATFCDESVQLFQEVVALDRKGLEPWSERRAAPHTIPVLSCSNDEKTAKSTAAR